MKKFILKLIILLFILNSCAKSKSPDFEDFILQRQDLGIITDTRLKEISGLAVSRKNEGIIWVHNDSGDEPRFFALRSNGEVIAEYQLKDAKAIDWEDIAIGPGPEPNTDYIYISDMGDNNQNRNDYAIYIIKEPTVNISINGNKIIIDEYDKIRVTYPDKSRDCEAIFVMPDSKDLYFLTKRDSLSLLFKLNYPYISNNVNTLQFIAQTKLGKGRTKREPSMICAADITSDGKKLLVKTYDSLFYYKIDGDIKDIIQTEPKPLEYIAEPQGEAVGWSKNGDAYYTISEVGPFNIEQHIYYYSALSDVEKSESDNSVFDVNIDHQNLNISVNSTLNNFSLEILNLKGEIVQSVRNIMGNIEISKSLFSNGTYIVCLLNGNRRITKVIQIVN